MVGEERAFVNTGGSIRTLRTASSPLDRFTFWKKKSKGDNVNHRIIVPNHMVPDNVPAEQHPNHGYLGNNIRTTKYTFLSFLPKNLFEQFHRFANLYFLLIVLLNWIPQINAFGKEIAMIPVIFVLGVTAVKDIYEDRRRHISDKRINNSTCRIYSRLVGRYIKVPWKNVKVGDIIHLSCNEVIPADILLLWASDEQGTCYIETANLDGENNLKQRQVVRGASSFQKDSFLPPLFRSIIECDLPNNKIYRFHGSLVHPNGEKVPLTKDNLLLRECVLKNTDFVEGMVVYAGHETKAMLNNNGPRYKRSKLERRMNWDVIWCVLILVILCFIGATGSGLWLGSFNNSRTVPFITFENEKMYNPAYEGFVGFWTFVIILQIMIPLSLYVSVEIIKLGQVYLIHNDIELYDSRTNKRLECRALNIPEEIGQVEFIFSDKTGTLTENEMIFRRCTIGGIDYNHHPASVSENASADMYSRRGTYGPVSIENSDFIVNSRLQEELSKMDLQLMISQGNTQVFLTRQSQRIQDFFLLLAVCNTVVVSKHPHCDKMNSSGLYLNTAANNLLDGNSPDFRAKSININSHKRNLLTPNVSPSPSHNSTPIKNRKLLTLPLFGNVTSSPPSPSPGDLRPIYEAESPDELALVTAAYKYNCQLLKRMADSITLSLPGEGLIEFKMLHLLPFDPQRKRMSIILEHPFTRQKILYCKGADSSMFSCLAPSEDNEMKEIIFKTQQHLNNYARRGLRILVMAKRILSAEEYNTWLDFHQEAELSLDEREQLFMESARRIEMNMELLGATGIEDRLQEGVPETIRALREAGIVIWVLTGDKQETAVNIAYSCQLFVNDMELITVNSRSKEATANTIKFYLDQVMTEESSVPSTPSSVWSSSSMSLSGRRKRGLVIDGRTLAYVLDKEIDNSFLELAQRCNAVLCCRATPIQKAAIVKLVKEQLQVLTLAIGDGANDVSMIQTADVGVGISGQEGMQAVMASDFAMARFQYLERLLLVHGHWCYDRLARMVLYFFYKNAGIIFIIFWFQLYCGFSGMVVIDQLYIMLYNLIFTSLPPLVIGVYDQDAPSDLLLKKPELYHLGRISQVYKPHSFWVNIIDALYQSIIIFFIPMLSYYDSTVGIWEFGTTITTCCLIVQLLHLCIECKSWTLVHVASMLFSIAIYFGFGILYNSICLKCESLPNPYWVMQHTMGTAIFWFDILLVAVLAVLPRYTIRMLQICLWPSQVSLALLSQREEETSHIGGEFSVTWSRSTSISSVVRISDLSHHHHRPVQNSMAEVV